MEDYPVSQTAINTITAGRLGADAIVKGQDDRLLVIVGPCSIHDTKAGLEYAKLLKAYADGAKDHLHILMRTYFEKPRTTIRASMAPFKSTRVLGSQEDSYLNVYMTNYPDVLMIHLLLTTHASSFFLCRKYTSESYQAELGIPVAVEFLDQISPQYIADTVSWGAIGARTTESQCHRELASGLSTPVGFKNGTNGSVGIAIDAIRAAKSGHVFLSVTKQGISAIVETNVRQKWIQVFSHDVVENHIKECVQELSKAGLKPLVMVDCSHGNSEKKHERQLVVAEDLANQLENPETQDSIMGVMIESNLVEGKQSLEALGPNKLAYGQSITDACLDWESTKKALDRLKAAVSQRRSQKLAAASSGSA
ncbi:hypothetical protein PGTUg99_015733 [Puccinia graminis f. sp. tritici]|uniref:Phospho-2-dehydro-3-deoxyheptonate aldolase n=1 Tax=Puccinia graminis f. sp. tritici TaxID=56615 RepID=A0A5B0SI62_PUCGR|nr:hypothetical protein PGTUg99_015733 [Puccinia graminis f. sp. tritici]